MDARSSDQYYHFVYDPILYGVSLDYWKEIFGSPSLSSNTMRFQGDTAASKEQYAFGDFVFRLNVPVAPVGGHSRRWGLINPAFTASKNSMYFDVADAVFTANVANDEGTTTSYTITWDSAWSATATDYRIHWDRGEVRFYINDIKVALFQDVSLIPRIITLPIYIRNNNGDNMDMTLMQLRNVYQVVSPKWAIASPADDIVVDYFDISKSETVTIVDVPTLTVSAPSFSVSDAIVTAESVTATVSDPSPSVNDAITVSEAVTITNTNLGPLSVFEASVVTESVTLTVTDPLVSGANDVVHVSEAITLSIT